MRRKLAREYPDLTFFFQPADIVGQILNFGLPAPIDVQVVGPFEKRAEELRHRAGDFAPPDEDSRRRRRPRASGERRPADAHERGSRARQSARPATEGRGQRHVDVAQLQRPGIAQLVGESGQQRGLSGGGADADLQSGFRRGADEHAGAYRRADRRSCWAIWRRWSAATPRRW